MQDINDTLPHKYSELTMAWYLKMCRRDSLKGWMSAPESQETLRGIKIWYEVPTHLKLANNPKSFRIELAKVWKRDGDVGVT